MYVEVSIPVSAFKTFTYSAFNFDTKLLFPGQSVSVYFRNKPAQGFIISVSKFTKFKGKILPITNVNQESFLISTELWKTVNWISKYYLSSIGKTLHSILSFQHLSKLEYNFIKQVHISDKGLHALSKNKIKYPNQLKILEFLKNNNKTYLTDLNHISKSYKSICNRLEELGMLSISNYNKIKPRTKKVYSLTKEQKIISNKIKSDWIKNNKPTLLAGISGSGKTLIYIDLISSFISNNKSVIVLVPEIALIMDLYKILDDHFPGKVISWHSKMKISDKKFGLIKIKNNKSTIIVSTRSGLFAPLSNLGLIVVDEEQETSYKEDSKSPYYNSRDVALMRSKFNQSNLILVSSSPSLESYYNSKKNRFNYYTLNNRYMNFEVPKILILNMKNKENYRKGSSLISAKLIDEINLVLSAKKQILLLHNRFGDYTKKLYKILLKLFPKSNIARYDSESVKKYGYFKILNDFHEKKIDILLGTQMIAKGIDFKNVLLVGVINADLGMSLPDFRAEEKLFQLAYQFIGRAGRHSNGSKAIVQTFNPDSEYIKSIQKYNIDKFYDYLLNDRKSLFYPPYSRLIRIILSSDNSRFIEKKSQKICDILEKNNNLKILGPSEAPIYNLNNTYRYHILIKMKKNYWIDFYNWINNQKELKFDNNSNKLKIKIDADPNFFL